MGYLTLRNVPQTVLNGLERVRKEENKHFYGSLPLQSAAILAMAEGIKVLEEKYKGQEKGKA